MLLLTVVVVAGEFVCVAFLSSPGLLVGVMATCHREAIGCLPGRACCGGGVEGRVVISGAGAGREGSCAKGVVKLYAES